MSVQFELYKTPMPKERKNKVRYHARPISFDAKIVGRIEESDKKELINSNIKRTKI